MRGTSAAVYAVVLACAILTVRADDDSEESSEEVVISVPGNNGCSRYCLQNPPPHYTLCATNGMTYPSFCHFKQHACIVGANWVAKHWGPCMRQPVTPKRVPTTRRRPPTTRPTMPTRPITTPRPTTTTRPTTMRRSVTTPVATTQPIPCPSACDLIFEPVCTTVGTYQSECAFNSVRCRGIIAREEMILSLGYCPDATTAGP